MPLKDPEKRKAAVRAATKRWWARLKQDEAAIEQRRAYVRQWDKENREARRKKNTACVRIRRGQENLAFLRAVLPPTDPDHPDENDRPEKNITD
jgi:hypothetical protein